ncbi:ABC-three component system protein [Sinosporangium album]|uniref:ABC-three component system protein n=1 Tax=Sinosporangium album TaxID=504805 RepID=UPI0015A3D7B9|nr:ABC-three component system protein [Sinosporangium album]
MEESSGNEFEKLFHRAMELSHAGFMPIRASGNIGDLSADGWCSCHRTLYACYAPEIFNASATQRKFRSDLRGALDKRREQFDIFTFVHNDQRGIHPVISNLIAQGAQDHPGIRLQQMGPQKLWYEVMGLGRDRMEVLLGESIPVHEVAYDVGMADVEELLTHLADARSSAAPLEEIPIPSPHKADFNKLGQDSKRDLQEARPFVHLVERYYHDVIDVTERDEVADGFAAYYRQMRQEYGDNPDEIFWQMQGYVLGQGRPRPSRLRAGNVVVAYFFEQCDIFEVPPAGWTPGAPTGVLS